MRNFRLVLSYDGTDFHGWQIQPNAVTVQGCLMEALEGILEETVQLHGSGRTDAGTHALAQVANFKSASKIPIESLPKALNRRLPPSLRVRRAEEAHPDFHARYRVLSKTYQYRVWSGEICPPFLWRYVHHYTFPLDLDAVSRAAALFEGEHDFASFAVSEGREKGRSSEERSTTRRIFRSEFRRRGASPMLVYEVRGNGFLRHMVRNMVGTLLEVGRGKLPPDDILRILAARERPQAGPTVPAKGLVLVHVDY